MSALLSPALKRDLGLVGWQMRYEQRAYWRNRRKVRSLSASPRAMSERRRRRGPAGRLWAGSGSRT